MKCIIGLPKESLHLHYSGKIDLLSIYFTREIPRGHLLDCIVLLQVIYRWHQHLILVLYGIVQILLDGIAYFVYPYTNASIVIHNVLGPFQSIDAIYLSPSRAC
ncbi:hypothetical protein THRCLA_00580 [Thraustotheca clavata]|uniref:Uncharacterized protein n=1 Tax=Thraustotheca clavata TaxID=74557 RepID=A0A1W0AAU1_9STRA|nr:hypothetical protein THRCLA_00580 [Thraustotheca clavata]